MDEEQPSGGSLLDKIWAVAGLLAAGVLAWMAVDLLLPRKPKVPGDDSGA